MEKGEEDGISALPDCVLIDILSRLPSTKEAIRTGTLSKRWKHLWTSVTTLIFFKETNSPVTPLRQNLPSMSDFISSVDKTLTQCRQLKLKKFQLYTSHDTRFISQVNNWIRHAISCNVEDLKLRIWCLKDKFPLDQSFFINTCFTDLTLSGCMLNPSGAISWKKLRSLCITYGKLDEVLIENILSGSPQLETLVLDYCYGYRRLDITSKSIKKLVFTGFYDHDNEYYVDNVIEINAPNILSLTIQNGLCLWKLYLLNVSCLVEANLDYKKGGYRETTHEEAEEEMFEGLIPKLGHVKELNIGPSCSEVLSRLEGKGFVIPSNMKLPDGYYEQLEEGDSSDSDSVESGDHGCNGCEAI